MKSAKLRLPGSLLRLLGYYIEVGPRFLAPAGKGDEDRTPDYQLFYQELRLSQVTLAEREPRHQSMTLYLATPESRPTGERPLVRRVVWIAPRLGRDKRRWRTWPIVKKGIHRLPETSFEVLTSGVRNLDRALGSMRGTEQGFDLRTYDGEPALDGAEDTVSVAGTHWRQVIRGAIEVGYMEAFDVLGLNETWNQLWSSLEDVCLSAPSTRFFDEMYDVRPEAYRAALEEEFRLLTSPLP